MALYLITIFAASLAGSRVGAEIRRAMATANGETKAGRMAPKGRKFALPLSAEAAAVRIIRNFRYFQLHYTLTLWAMLFLSLLPRPLVLWTLLLLITAPVLLWMSLEWFLSHQCLPKPKGDTRDSADHRSVLSLLGQIVCSLVVEAHIKSVLIGPVIVAFLVDVLVMVTVAELILSLAVVRLLVSLGFGLPLILFHAVLRVDDELQVSG
uniref:PRA1 family protein n=1 Tax=Nelumbo nucifera TaxID=4432 RepID=A0A822ZT05_NELNU|nr:TPA_asm: hypothetical protein HUJ06_017587 [Nelumbo nucifera]